MRTFFTLLLSLTFLPGICQSADDFSPWKTVSNSRGETVQFHAKDLTIVHTFDANLPIIEVQMTASPERGYFYIVGTKRQGGIVDTTQQLFDVDLQNPVFSPLLSVDYSHIIKIYFDDFSDPSSPQNSFPAGNGYSKILYQDKAVTLAYTLRLVKRKLCSYDLGGGTTNMGSAVVSLKSNLPFAAYYYQASYKFINHTGKPLFINGYIHGSAHLGAQKHITSLGETGRCLGCDKDNTCSKLYYYSWNGPLPAVGQTIIGNFWTEIANEEPAWKLTHSR